MEDGKLVTGGSRGQKGWNWMMWGNGNGLPEDMPMTHPNWLSDASKRP